MRKTPFFIKVFISTFVFIGAGFLLTKLIFAADFYSQLNSQTTSNTFETFTFDTYDSFIQPTGNLVNLPPNQPFQIQIALTSPPLLAIPDGTNVYLNCSSFIGWHNFPNDQASTTLSATGLKWWLTINATSSWWTNGAATTTNLCGLPSGILVKLPDGYQLYGIDKNIDSSSSASFGYWNNNFLNFTKYDDNMSRMYYLITSNFTPQATVICEPTDILCNLSVKIFMPSQASIEQFSNLPALASTKAPFGYFNLLANVFSNLNASSTTSTIAFSAFAFALVPLNVGLSIILWLLFAVALYFRFRHLEL